MSTYAMLTNLSNAYVAMKVPFPFLPSTTYPLPSLHLGR